MSEKIFCIKAIQNKRVSGTTLGVKAAASYFTHNSAANILGVAAFLEEHNKPCRHCPTAPTRCRVPDPAPAGAGSRTSTDLSWRAYAPALALSCFKPWFAASVLLLLLFCLGFFLPAGCVGATPPGCSLWPGRC